MKLLLSLLGPTASGKTEFSVGLAKALGGEIVCLDSTTVYRGLDIGTSKPTPEQRALVPHSLVDILDPDQSFSAHDFCSLANQAIEAILQRGKLPIIVGGTYFYLKALQYGMVPNQFLPPEMLEEIEREYESDEGIDGKRMHQELLDRDPAMASVIHPNDRYRLVRALATIRFLGKNPSELRAEPPTPSRIWMKYAIIVSRRGLSQSIMERTDRMLQAGLVKEAAYLSSKYPYARSLGAIGYAEAIRHLRHELTEKQVRTEIIEKTRQLAKRQMTWLRSDPEIRFVDSRDTDRIVLEVKNMRYALESPP